MSETYYFTSLDVLDLLVFFIVDFSMLNFLSILCYFISLLDVNESFWGIRDPSNAILFTYFWLLRDKNFGY